MTTATQSKFSLSSSRLIYGYFRDFEQQARHWWAEDKGNASWPFSSFVKSTLDLYESYALGLLRDLISASLDSSNKSDIYNDIYDIVDEYIIDCEFFLENINIELLEAGLMPIFSDSRLSGIRGRILRQVEKNRSKFLGADDTTTTNRKLGHQKLGRRRKYAWEEACIKVWGEIYRGDFEPTMQKEVEVKLISLLAANGEEPNAETVRPYASLIMKEYQYDPMDEN